MSADCGVCPDLPDHEREGKIMQRRMIMGETNARLKKEYMLRDRRKIRTEIRAIKRSQVVTS